MAINSNKSVNVNVRLGNPFALLENEACENLTGAVEVTASPPSSASEESKGNDKKAFASMLTQMLLDDRNRRKKFFSKSFYHGKGRRQNGRSNDVSQNNNQLRGHDLERQNGKEHDDLERLLSQNGNGRSNGVGNVQFNGVRPNNNQSGEKRGHDLERKNGSNQLGGKQSNGYHASKKSGKGEEEKEKEVCNGESEGEGWQVICRRKVDKKENGSSRNYGQSSRSKFATRQRIYFGEIPSNIVVAGYRRDVAQRDQNSDKAKKNVTMDKNGNKEWISNGKQKVKQINQTDPRDKFRNADARPPSYEDSYEDLFPPLKSS